MPPQYVSCGLVTARLLLSRFRISFRPRSRATSEAFFASKIVVCEGKTELGLIRAIEGAIARPEYGAPLSLTATAIIEGGGASAPSRARDLASLGYETLLFADSDRPLDPVPASLRAAGVIVAQWEDSTSTEERVCLDVPFTALQEIVDLAASIKSIESVRDAIVNRLCLSAEASYLNLESWLEIGGEEAAIRKAIAEAAKASSQAWFKRVDYAEDLGRILASRWQEMAGTNLVETVESIFRWSYAS